MKRLSSFLIFGLAVLSACTSQPHLSAVNDPHSKWEIVFRDEFKGHGPPDPEIWVRKEYNRANNKKGPDGWWLKENVRLDGHGHLMILVNQIPNRNPDKDDDRYDYGAGVAATQDKFEQVFGRYEARIKLPSTPGWWGAFWLFNDSVHRVDGSGEDGTEIDIVEFFGWTDEINQAVHWDGYGKAHKSKYDRTKIAGIRKGWHVFALEWYEDEYVFYVDGVETWRTDAGGVSKVPLYVKFSAEISMASWSQNRYWANKVDNGRLPDKMLVDWVRVYRLKDEAAVPVAP